MEVLNLWEAGEMGWASTMLSILRLKEGLRKESLFQHYFIWEEEAVPYSPIPYLFNVYNSEQKG